MFCSLERFFQSLTRTRVFFWNEVIFVFFWPSRRGGWFLPGLLDFWDFLEFLQFWALFFWNEIFVFGLFGFSAVSSVFFQILTKTRVFFFSNEVIWFFFLSSRRGGGGFSQDFWIFWIFFLEVLQFWALFLE